MIRQQLENGQRGVGLHRIAHQVIPPRECLLKQLQAFNNLIGGIDIKRCAEFACQGLKRHFAAVQSALRLRIMKRTGR